jgi:protein-S-isoprenylcysteine O-methyltransferase Ste14
MSVGGSKIRDMSEAERQSKVVPAPILVLASVVIALVAHRLFPIHFLPPLGIAGVGVGIAICLASLALGLSGVREFRRQNTPTSPFRPTTAFVTSGVFRFTRNPMYLSFVTLLVGVAVAVNSVAFLGATLLLLVLMQFLVVRPEERFLLARYGTAFQNYSRSTRRWL